MMKMNFSKGSRISPTARARKSELGILMADLMVGLAILTLAIMPLGFSFARERQMLKIEYQRSVIVELVDGEMEILVAGAAKNLPEGVQNLAVESRAIQKLPAGIFQLAKTGNHLRLEWLPGKKCGIGAIVREATLQ